MNPHQITAAEYAAAIAAGRAEAETEVRAQAVRYVPERDAIEIVTNRNAGFLIPRQWIGALQDVPTEDLAKLEVAMLPSQAVAAIFASRGGQATSDAKRISSQANGRNGGRPRKRTTAEVA
jgi:hypothetical protein